MCCNNVLLPPRVAESRKWVPYFLMMLSVIFCKLGLLPRSLMLWMKSGSKGTAAPSPSCLSAARLLTFHRPNSLWVYNHLREMLYCMTVVKHNLSANPNWPSHSLQWHSCCPLKHWLNLAHLQASPSACLFAVFLFHKSLLDSNSGARTIGGISLCTASRASMGSQVHNLSTFLPSTEHEIRSDPPIKLHLVPLNFKLVFTISNNK